MNITTASWVDAVIVTVLVGSIAFGAYQGVLRQVFLLVAAYAGSAVAAQYHEPVARVITQTFPANAPAESARVLAFLIVGLAFMVGVTWMSWFAYGTTRLTGLAVLDNIGGALLGAVVGVFVIALGLMMADYAAQSALVEGGSIRYAIRLGLADSMLMETFFAPLPLIQTALRPWLPTEITWVLGS